MASQDKFDNLRNKSSNSSTQADNLAAMRPSKPVSGRVITHSLNPSNLRRITESGTYYGSSTHGDEE